MGTGWRRAFCTTIPRDGESIETEQHKDQISSPSPVRTCGKLRIFSSISNPPTPKFNSEALSAYNTPTLHCKTKSKSSTPSSPRSPFSILKTTLRLSKSCCGVCLQSVKTGQGMAIYTAECAHSFHFPCISQHVRKQGSLVCPVCNCAWKDVPQLNAQNKTHPLPHQNDVVEKIVTCSTRSPKSVDDKKLQSSVPAVKTDKSRPFNDDEPLLSRVGSRFNPIPEVENEENEDEVEEFQGFFVNSTPSSTPTKNHSVSAFADRRRIQQNVDLKLLPEAAVITAGRFHETFAVALRVKAPPLQTPSHRAPIDLVVVLDVSGSIITAKLHMIKRAMRLVISSLRSSDRLSIIAFSSSPQRLLPLRRMSHHGQRLARRIVDHLSLGEGKSVNEALKVAAMVLEDRRERNPVASIVLLSDGKDQYSQQPKPNPTRHGHIEIPVHSLGSYNNPDSVADAFAKRVGGLLSVVAQDLRLQLGFSAGSAPAEITAVYSSNGQPRLLIHDSIKLGDLYAEEERELLVEIRVPTSAIGSHHVMMVRCSYRNPVGTVEVMYGRERALLVPRPRAVRSSDPRIERLRNVFLTMRAVAEARRLAEVREFGTAQQLLVSARALVAQSSNGSAEEYVRWLETEVAAVQWQRQQSRRMGEQHVALGDEKGEPLTPTSAWRAAEQLAKVAAMKELLNRSRDLHGFENARF